MINRTCMVALTLWLAGLAHAEVILHVAPNGRDNQPGTEVAPLQSLAGAKDRLRQLRAEGAKGKITVVFAPGRYVFAKEVEFGKEDSGTQDAPVVFRAAAEGKVRFTGGLVVDGWKKVEDPEMLNRLPQLVHSYVRVADLKTLGITDFGELTSHGFARGSAPAEAELFYDDVPMTLARWPNKGFRGIEGADGIQRVQIDTDRLSRWTGEPDPWVFAYWHHDWAELYEPIVDIDAKARVLVRSEKIKPQYGITKGRARWYAYNLLSELDRPGEYYLDRQTGRLYFWPPKTGGQAVLSQSVGLISGQNLSHVTFQGFILEACRATAVRFKGGESCRVVGCTIRNTGHRAVVCSGGTRQEVYGCDVYQCGEGGISLSGGDRKTLAPAKHNAENNHVHHYSRRARTYKTGISISGVGCRMAHNLVHHGPHMALSAGGNDHLVEYNEIHNAVYESGDAGAYYVGRDWTQRGNVLRYNYWHQIVGATGHGGMTIYLDDQHCGHTIQGNLFERCSRAVFIGGGDDNIVTNNVFLDCWRAAHIDNRGMGWQKRATDDPNGTLRKNLRAMPIDSELWKRRYPTLVNILADEPNIPKRNVFARNISAGGIWDDIHAGTRKYQTVKDNLVYDDSKAVRLIKDETGKPLELRFKDPAAVKAIGFEPIPLNRIGVYADPRRASWPVRHEVDLVSLPKK